jgi:hypothetical protein
MRSAKWDRLESAFFWFFFVAIPVTIAGLTWLVTDILREPEEKRLYWATVAFVVALVIALIVLLVLWLRKRGKESKLENGLAAGGADRKGEIDALRKSWRESVRKLKGAAVAGGGRRALAALPWYVIIGAPASGKSTLLRQSGIDFPVGDAAIRGLQGTRNCDWWFSNVGIFLDTAGRYISDESADEWAQFLALVRKHRTGAPINGVIVAVPAADLLEKSPEDRDLEARRIRARLDELIDHLGVNFPVWFVATKVDLVGGFVEFFGHADATMRSQMMGWTVDQEEGARFDLVNFERRFHSMIHRLREIRPMMVGSAKLRDRPAAFAFPDELSQLGEPLGRLLQKVFEPNVYQETPLLRGVYVTSATQQGTPLQRAAARVRELLGAPAVDADKQGAIIQNAYFVRDLMQERIVQDQNMTWTTQREVDRGKHKRVGLNLIGSSVGVFLFLVVIAFGMRAASGLDGIQKRVDEVVQHDVDSAVDRCDRLWLAARESSADNYTNLGLSQQLSLRLDLQEKQREVYRDALLVPLMADLKAAVAAGDGPGLEKSAEAYAQFREVVAALERAANPDREPEKPQEGEEEEDEAAAAEDPKAAKREPSEDADLHAPKRFFTKRQRDAFASMQDRLRAPSVRVLPKRRKKDDQSLTLLFDVIWRNRGGADEVRPQIDEIRALWKDRVRRYVEAAGAAVRDVQRDHERWASYVRKAKEGFETACRTVREQFKQRRLEPEDLQTALKLLADASTGRGASGDGASAAGAAGEALLRSIQPTVALLTSAKPPLIDPVELSGYAGHDDMMKWTAAAKATEDGDPSAAKDKVQSALNALSKRLSELQVSYASLDTWSPSRVAGVPEALRAIDLEVGNDMKEWLAAVTPPLAALSGAKDPEQYRLDDERWGIAVEWIEPTIRRNMLFHHFVFDDKPGALPRLASQRARDLSNFDRTEVADALENMVLAVDWADDPARFIAASNRDRAAQVAKDQFRKLLDLVQDQWDSRLTRCAPPYGGASSPFDYIGRFASPTGEVARLAESLQKAWGDWSIPSSIASSTAARDAWEGVRALKARYELLGPDFPSLQEKLGKLWRRAGSKCPEDLADVARDFGGTSGRPAWDAAGLFESAGGAFAGAAVRDGLASAVRAAEKDLVQRIADRFNGEWRALRSSLVDARARGPKDRLEEATKSFRTFQESLALFFGDRLVERPGRRLEVSRDFLQTVDEIATATDMRPGDQGGLSLTIWCRKVPSPAKDQGAVDYPCIRAEYREDGAEPAVFTWSPPPKGELTIKWTPGRSATFTLRMCDSERGSASALFKSWSGPRALLDAIRDGRGAGGGGSLTWTGASGYTDAVFEATYDSARFARLVDPGETDPERRIAKTCVEILPEGK